MIHPADTRRRALTELGRIHLAIQKLVQAKNKDTYKLQVLKDMRDATHEIFKASRRLEIHLDRAIAQRNRTKNPAG